MNVVVWVVSGVLAVVFLLAGVTKLTKSKAALASNPAMGWAVDLPTSLIKFIAVAEMAGAVGLLLPGAVGIGTWLVPAAAVGLALLMIGAVITHGRRHELSNVAVNVVLLVLAVFVAVERFGPERF